MAKAEQPSWQRQLGDVSYLCHADECRHNGLRGIGTVGGNVPRFYFHLREHDRFTPDKEGIELPDLDSVRKEAIEGARAIASLDPSGGYDGQTFEVIDEFGTIVLIYAFKDAFTQ